MAAHRPPPPGVTFRPYRGAANLPAMAVCAKASFASDGIEVVRTEAHMVRDYATFTACKPLEDVGLAQRAGLPGLAPGSQLPAAPVAGGVGQAYR